MGFENIKKDQSIAGLSLYDESMAMAATRSNIDFLLVGDSVMMVTYGHENTHDATLDIMLKHYDLVSRGAASTLPVVLDLPINTYESSALSDVTMTQLPGWPMVKIEGHPDIVNYWTQAGYAVMGHTGLKPQQVQSYKVARPNSVEMQAVIEEAWAIEKAGAQALILECVPEEIGKKIAEDLTIPVIGIGAGRYVDGQILVAHDVLGSLARSKTPRFVRTYSACNPEAAFMAFSNDVKNKLYPAEKEVYYPMK